jgi:hypothetical protein
VTRPGKAARDQALADLFASDPEAAVLRVLERSDAALAAGGVKAVLVAAGVAHADAERAWSRVQKKIKSYDDVVVEPGYRYRWRTRDVTVTEALELLAHGGLPAGTSAALVAVVRAALASPAPDAEEAARQRQKEIDGVRSLAELAIEVEELIANEVSTATVVQRVRARVKRTGLEPIERAGDEIAFDRRRHKPIGPPIRDGAPVVVVRPGYVWKAPAEDILLGKAIVEE